MAEGLDSPAPWSALRGTVLGSEDFAKRVGGGLEERVDQEEIPRRERFPGASRWTRSSRHNAPWPATSATSASETPSGRTVTPLARSAATSDCTTRRLARSSRRAKLPRPLRTSRPPLPPPRRLKIHNSRPDPSLRPACASFSWGGLARGVRRGGGSIRRGSGRRRLRPWAASRSSRRR